MDLRFAKWEVSRQEKPKSSEKEGLLLTVVATEWETRRD